MDWQPIETAPKDGTAFRARIPGLQHTPIIAWTDGLLNSDEEDCGGWYIADYSTPPESWSEGVCWSVNADGVPSVQPTHWAAL